MSLSIDALHADESLRHREFPVTRKKIFLSHAAVCPLPARVAAAVSELALSSAEGDQEEAFYHELIHDTRSLGARLMGCTPEETAFVGPTSLGLSFIAAGLQFKRHHHVLVYHDDYPSNVYPWMALADRGVEVRFLNVTAPGRIRVRDITGQVDENTRLVALASCHFLSGWRIEVEAIGRALRERGILFCVDGIQTLGAFPTPLASVDFLAADSHKWMLGPLAAGLMYVRREAQAQLHPTTFGWHNVRSPDFVAQDEMELRPDARRYEAGSHNLLGLAGLRASLSLLLEVGVDNIAAELLRKRARLLPALAQQGWEILHASAPQENSSGIVTFTHAQRDLPAIHRKLGERDIVTSLRRDRAGKHYLRLSPHFYNTDAELDQTLAALAGELE